MKKIFFLATAFFFSVAVAAQAKADDLIKVNTENHDFGKVKQRKFIVEPKHLNANTAVTRNFVAASMSHQLYFKLDSYVLCPDWIWGLTEAPFPRQKPVLTHFG